MPNPLSRPTRVPRAGTSNPRNPRLDDPPFFRTDLGLLVYFDGKRWLTATEYVLSMPIRDALEPFLNGQISSALYTPIDTSNGGMWLVRWVVTTYEGSVTGSIFSTFNLKPVANDGTLGTTIATFDNSADVTANYTTHVTTIGAAVAATTKALAINVVATGSPGSAYAHAMVIYRMIVT